MHGLSLITTLAAAFGLALLFGFLASKLRLPPLVGYLVAGVLIGPATPGFVANVGLAQETAEVGVILLMFGVGLHFSRDDLLSVRRIAVAGALGRIVLTTLIAVMVARAWGWSLGAGIVFGIALSVASTVVLLRMLEDKGALTSMTGRIAMGWLVVEDLATVFVLVLLPPLAGVMGGTTPTDASHGLVVTIALTLGRVALFLALMLVIARRALAWVLWQVAGTGSRELFTLAVIAVGVGIAWGAARLFGVSFALGAFLAGMVLGESALSHRAAEESLPLRDAFAVLFFVSVGMLFDPAILVREPVKVLVTLGIVVVGKTLIALGIVKTSRYSLDTSLTVSAGLAQIGEFSFILATLGASLGILPAAGVNLILAAAILSIAVNPLLFRLVDPVGRLATRWPAMRWMGQRRDDELAALALEIPPERLTNHVVLVGFGRVGCRIADALRANGIPFVVAEQNRELVEQMRARGMLAVSGDASQAEVLVQAHVARARDLVVATPNLARARTMLDIARRLNPRIHAVVRTHTDEETELLRQERVDAVFMGEHELAASMIRYLLEADHARGGPAPG